MRPDEALHIRADIWLKFESPSHLKSEKQKLRWAAMRALVETYAMPIETVAASAGISLAFLKKTAKNENWQPNDAQQVLCRLRLLLSAQIDELETHAANGEPLDEKSARTLGTLARIWEKITELETSMSPNNKNKSANLEKQTAAKELFELGSANLDNLRAELERRIRALVEQKNASPICERTDTDTASSGS